MIKRNKVILLRKWWRCSRSYNLSKRYHPIVPVGERITASKESAQDNILLPEKLPPYAHEAIRLGLSNYFNAV